MRSHALPHRLCHQLSGIVAFSQRHFLAYTYGQAGTTRSIYPLLSPGATWPLTPLGSQAIPRRSVPQNTRQPVRFLSLCAGHCISPHPSPLSHGCLLREERWAVRNCQPGASGPASRRGGSKAYFGLWPSYHWYTWDLYLQLIYLLFFYIGDLRGQVNFVISPFSVNGEKRKCLKCWSDLFNSIRTLLN